MENSKGNNKTSKHYVSNEKLLEAFIAWKKNIRKAKRLNLPKPPMPDFIGECIMMMTNKLSQKYNFASYSYRDEMISEAIESCVRYAFNFNPKKSNNPFAYLTQIIYHAFIRRIEKEHKQLYIKMKIIDKTDFLDSYEKQEGDSSTYNNSYVDFLQENKGDVISRFENRKEAKKKRAAERKEEKIFGMFEEEDEEPVVRRKKVKAIGKSAKKRVKVKIGKEE